MMTRRELIRYGTTSGLLAALGSHVNTEAQPPPFQGPDKSLRIAFFTDVHAMPGDDVQRTLQRAAKQIRDARADIILGGGDFIHRGHLGSPDAAKEKWNVFRTDFFDRLEKQPELMVGNHDCTGMASQDNSTPVDDYKADFRGRFGLKQSYRHFEQGGVHFILLDSIRAKVDRSGYTGGIDSVQLKWLDKTLQQIPSRAPIILCSHIPLVTTFMANTKSPTAAVPENWVVANSLDVLKHFTDRNLILTLQGHLHIDEDVRWSRRRFIMGGAVCGRWWRGPNHGTEGGYGVLTLRREQAEWEYYSLTT